MGTIAAYGSEGDTFRFYEINPNVRRFAEDPFTFLSDSPASTEVIMGDARLSLEAEDGQNFDLLVLDAFNGDSIPIHLITRETFSIYLRHIKKDGIIAVNISNRYLDLLPVMQKVADHFQLHIAKVYVSTDQDNLATQAGSQWVLIGMKKEIDSILENENASVPYIRKDIRIWTDDYSNLLQIFR